ncbi:NAD(P)H-dependent glycerol-3-phosphate dehydrogenase [Aureimonas populi]|uniref:Glycerol-3-phosphate dehydrogenase [NAD(P)+] n=1 Tax=Aureimonas populi TaxID=1701758 RepID=A0ABW5CGT0_9HYPH|nr:NAD(P)H-dependent glycerol-3-phosphate dehydrogenase [Aureimonas populi]
MRLTVIGGGAWGTALASVYARKGFATTLYARDEATAESVNEAHENPRYLPGIALPDALRASTVLSISVESADLILLVVPAQTLRAVACDIRPFLEPGVPLVLCAKGIERETGLFASHVVAQELPEAPLAVLSGPSFAQDVAAGLPTAVTLAAEEGDLAEELSRTLSADTFRIYASTDMLGVEAGGALKNVLALAAGAVSGRGLGASALAALVTRGLSELRRLGEALGARPETLTGLSGLGDLVLTCSSAQSRNFAYGQALGRGEDVSGLKLAEGVHSAAIAARLAREKDIEAPIVQTVAAILEGRLSVDEAIGRLMARPLKREED